jgi:hypothetical protein
MVGIEEKIVLDRILKRRYVGYSLVVQDGVPHSFKAIIDLRNFLVCTEF